MPHYTTATQLRTARAYQRSFPLHTLLLLPMLLESIAAQVRFQCDPCVSRPDYTIVSIVHGRKEDPFWQQVKSAATDAAEDMNVRLIMQLHDSLFNSTHQAADIQTAVNRHINGLERIDALLVTIPDGKVLNEVEYAVDVGIPVFGFNAGYHLLPPDSKVADQILFLAQDEAVAGQTAAQEFLRQRQNVTKALFVNHERNNPSLQQRYQGFSGELHQHDNQVIVDELVVDPSDIVERVTSINSALKDCSYDAVLLAGTIYSEATLAALEEIGCNNRTLLGVFDTDETVFSALLKGTIAFATSQQQYLQAVMPVLLSSLYATTGKRPSHPKDTQWSLYSTGPSIITRDNIPTDTHIACEIEAFPACHHEDTTTIDSSSSSSIPSKHSTEIDVFVDDDGGGTDQGLSSCFDRTNIRIGAVLHGTFHNPFWDIIQNSAEQAARDMNVNLELVRFPAQDNNDVLYNKMASSIKTLCESGVNGIFMSIPNAVIMKPAIQVCLNLASQ
jgi:ABC-type sugar transport system substrate-binding protein